MTIHDSVQPASDICTEESIGHKVDFVTLLGRPTDYGCSKDIGILRRVIGRRRTTLFSTRHRRLLGYFRKPDLQGVILHLERLQREGIHAGSPSWLLPNQERFPER